ncbi:MAG: small multi-drug export protein, partial [Kiritimatiellae bacterium]|nr:small multi-drug export protein [Kiritimatiellia bacterium]
KVEGRQKPMAADCRRLQAIAADCRRGGRWIAAAVLAAGLALERVSAEEWPEDVRARASAANEAQDAQWSAMAGGDGATNARWPEAHGKPFVFTNEEDLVFSRGYRASEGEPNVWPKGTKITVFPRGYRDAAEKTAAGAAEKEPLGQRIAERLQARGWPVEGAIAAISLLPIVELRGAIPVGHVLIGDADRETHFGPEDWARAGKVFLWAVVGNLLPIPFILWLLGPLSAAAMKCGPGRRFFEWLFARTRKKTADIEKYEFWGLALFVAVPLPVTGAWTGAMAGWLLGIPFWQALASIAIGVCAAGCIMTALSLMGWVGLAIALVALVAVFGGGAWRAVRKK